MIYNVSFLSFLVESVVLDHFHPLFFLSFAVGQTLLSLQPIPVRCRMTSLQRLQASARDTRGERGVHMRKSPSVPLEDSLATGRFRWFVRVTPARWRHLWQRGYASIHAQRHISESAFTNLQVVLFEEPGFRLWASPSSDIRPLVGAVWPDTASQLGESERLEVTRSSSHVKSSD